MYITEKLNSEQLNILRTFCRRYATNFLRENNYGTPIFITISGSWQQGLGKDTSDLDIKCIFIKDKHYFTSLTQNVKNFNIDFPGAELPSSYGLDKYLEELLDLFNNEIQFQFIEFEDYLRGVFNSNATLLEILFAQERDILLNYTTFTDPLWRERNKVLSKKVYYSYTAYAKGQLQKIENHKQWIVEHIKEQPKRSDYGIPDLPVLQIRYKEFEALIQKEVDALLPYLFQLPEEERSIFWETVYAALASGWEKAEDIPSNLLFLKSHWMRFRQYYRDFTTNQFIAEKSFMSYIDAERKYRQDLKLYNRQKHWLTERNARRKLSEEKYGYDIKHASHLIRLLTDAKYILLRGRYPLDRSPEHIELSAKVKRGEVSYEDAIALGMSLADEIEKLFLENPASLPERPDVNAMNRIYAETVKTYLGIK